MLTVGLLSASPVSAQEDGDISVDIVVDGVDATDGERIEVGTDEEVRVNVSVESETELNTLEARLHNKSITMGVNETEHHESYFVGTEPGANVFTAEATDLDGNTATASVELYREPVTAVEMRQVVERLSDRKQALEDEIEELEERRDALEEKRYGLEEQLLVLEEEVADDEEFQEVAAEERNLPGFTVVAALSALLIGLLAVRRRRS